MVRTRMPGGVGGKAREGLPIPISLCGNGSWDLLILYVLFLGVGPNCPLPFGRAINFIVIDSVEQSTVY